MLLPSAVVLPFMRRTVLVIEDDKDLREVFGIALKEAGFRVRDTDDGVAALRLVEHTPPDLIVLDLVLPTLDGVSVRQEIAAHAHTRHIPVIVVTGSAVDVSNLDVAALLRKPIEPHVLVAAVRAALLAGVPQPANGSSERLPNRR